MSGLFNPPIPYNRKMFEWLMYGSIAIESVNVAISKMVWGEIAGFVVVALGVVALTWAAARRGRRWAAWVVVSIIAAGIILGFVMPDDTTETMAETVLGVISFTLQIAALALYFFVSAKPEPVQASA